MTTGISSIFLGHFVGRRVAVTGAARGIGLGIAQGFAQAGAAVVMLDRDPQVLGAADTLLAAGLDASGHVVDVTDEREVAAVFAGLESLDVLVNNAGVITISEFEKLSVADFERVLRVNITGAFLCCKAALPLLKRSPSPVILNAASGQARDGFIYTPHYAASKFGIMGMTQSLAKEFASIGMRVNAYCPGIVRTEMWEYNDEHWGELLGFAPGALIEKWISDIPMGRAAEPEDVANLLLFLASDAATYITGQTINIDGGMFMS